ncbi:sigma 54-interacting transcriptional regulator [Pleomorphomonas sp. PLEO]|uniref:sigma 54-interacting transcriptional regulator n=1 Tax=Pleomorphomonas sp. PLEO TaxID=3239306 RepID=UPI00351F41B8
MTDLASVLDRPLPAIARRAPVGDDDGRRLIARIAGILDRNPPADAVEELKRLLAIHGARPAGIRESACDGRDRPHCVVGKHPAMLAAADTVRRAAPTDLPVLILGESGTGKGLFAEMLHRHSARTGPLVKVNCAALPEALIESELFGHERGAFTGASGERKGRFELAAGGTLFLDEIGDTSPAFQVKLLRVLQDGEFERVGGTRTLRADVRIVAATNRDLAAAIADGSFRADLYYRLSVVPVALPPLRDRRADIPELARRILEDFDRANGGRHTLGVDAVDLLIACNFPGNIRELENCVKRAAVMANGPVVSAASFSCRQGCCRSLGVCQTTPPPTPTETFTEKPRALSANATTEAGLPVGRDELLEALTAAGWSQAKAARLLGLSPRQVGYAVRRYGVALKKW